MRVLLDENLDHRLKRFFGEQHAVVTVRERGWSGKENGELVQDAQGQFDALVTMDQGIPHQQNLMEVDLVNPAPRSAEQPPGRHGAPRRESGGCVVGGASG